MLIIGKQQPRVEIYHNHDLAMSCIDDGFSVFLTTHITVMCFPSNCRDPAAQGSLQISAYIWNGKSLTVEKIKEGETRV